jgi:hypothetical protein
MRDSEEKRLRSVKSKKGKGKRATIAVPGSMRYTLPEGSLGVHRLGKLTYTSSE